MLNTIIIDDEPYCCDALETLIQRYHPELAIAGIYHSGEAALAGIRRINPQLVFLDIEMPSMNGFEMLEQITDLNFGLIITTSYNQYAINAIRFSAIDYLLKPVDREELHNAIQKATRQLEQPLPRQLEILLQKMNHSASPVQRIALPTMEGLQMIALENIIRCASDSNYTVFYLKGKKKLVASRTLKDVEEMLEDHSFLRVHNSHLVNLNAIEKYMKGEGGYLLMSDGSTVDVSRSRKESLLKKLLP